MKEALSAAQREQPMIELVTKPDVAVSDEINPCVPNTGMCNPNIMCIPKTEGCMPTNPCIPQATCNPNFGPLPPRR